MLCCIIFLTAQVYAVEATDMAKHARSLVAHNKVHGVGC